MRSEEEHRRTTERVLKRIVTHHVGQMAYRRRRRVQTAIVSAGIAAFLGLLAALGNVPDPYAGIRLALGILAVGGAAVAGATGLMAWAAASAERLLEVEISEAGEVLSDRGDFSATLDEIGVPDFFERSNLETMVGQWEQKPHPPDLLAGNRGQRPLSETAARIGRVDFVRLLLAKGLELTLLEEAVGDDSGQRIYGYRRS